MVRPLFLLLIVWASLLACARATWAQEAGHLSLRERIAQRRAAQPDAASAAPLGAGTHTLQLNYQGQPRKYLLHLPPGTFTAWRASSLSSRVTLIVYLCLEHGCRLKN